VLFILLDLRETDVISTHCSHGLRVSHARSVRGSHAADVPTTGFDTNAGTHLDGADVSLGVQWIPNDYFEFLVEFVHRQTHEPYYAGHGGSSGPTGYDNPPVENPGGQLCTCWRPDLVDSENRIILAWLARLQARGALS
jgi:hypothetical protein